MSSYSEARTRLASLDADAVSALGISPITLKKYTWPKGSLAIIFTCTLLTLLTFPRRQNFQPGANIHSLLSQFGDWGIAYSKFCYTIQPFLIYPLVGLHAFEVAYMERSRLSRYNVPRFSGLWWKWVASTFVEGWGAFVRVDGMVKEEEEKRAKAKH
ncbi:MAG: hypothetical protein L6R40_004339 [Gallowayella cf. fulva]|nr:MAG: hypothetical protein L6R40_004339 [Xanthomendoza cf. fulva]